ncbi:MAG: hypothetical protein ROW52_04075 [Anaerolineaceae bacterium]|jgi:hypothetical protein
MDKEILQQVCAQVYKRFPDVKGSRPKVRAYHEDLSLLIFQSHGTTADGRSIPRTVRVVVNPEGKIKKVTTSR